MKPTCTKIPVMKYFQYKGGAIRLSKNTPYSVEEVIVSIKGSDKVKKITTFRDSGGNITERVFDYPDRPLLNRLYESTEDKIGANELVDIKTKHDYIFDRRVADNYDEVMELSPKKRVLLWTHEGILKDNGTTTDYVSRNLNEKELVHTQVKVTNIKPSRQRHEFIEYPLIKNGKKRNSRAKELSFEVKRSDNSVVDSTITASWESLIPKDDKYLGFRALPINNAKTPFVNRYIRERGLSDKDIKIDEEFNSWRYPDEHFYAIFDPKDGTVKFNKDKALPSKSLVAALSRHEIEHAWHYFLQGLLNEGGTPWQTELSQKFGKITDRKTLKEAKNYDQSIRTYVPYYVDRARYRRNYIEIKAKQEELKEQDNYNISGESIRKSFKHIPSRFL